ncbi:MAG TPA: HAMP domain-containing sensor histidine kinase [Spirochaetia bacterium]|nr:HAMP domain-containing sensor histidine kinase [Spirochaetia bacterium]
MTGRLRSPAVRFAMFALPAVVLPAVILAILGYHSLRQWERSADTLFRAQTRDLASMAAEKVDMVLRAAEDESIARLQDLLAGPRPSADAVQALIAATPLIEGVALFDRHGSLRYPPVGQGADGRLFPALARELPPDRWTRPGVRHLAVEDRLIILAAVPKGPGGEPLLAALSVDREALRRELLEKTLAPLEGPAIPVVLDAQGRPVYARASLERATPIVTVPLGGTLPAWQLALYQPPGAFPQDAVRRQVILFSAVFGLLLLVIAAGLGATYRLVRREAEMAELKADFVANVSHDLKTPLALIRMFGETLEMGRVADEATRQEYYGVITRESERLSRLLDNVLDFSRIERGRRTYRLAPAAVSPIVHETLESFAFVLAQQQFTVKVVVAPDLPEVPLDTDAVRQALANLVDNAIKYSTERRVLQVEAGLQDGQLAVTVADEGIGIPPEEQGQIFEKFYRIGRSDTQAKRGSGIGLALVRHIADAHGGQVTVESQPGQGSRFTLWFPLGTDAPASGGAAIDTAGGDTRGADSHRR